MGTKPLNVRQLTRELIIEYGDNAIVVARAYIEECRYNGDADGKELWEAVRDALVRISPGSHSKQKRNEGASD